MSPHILLIEDQVNLAQFIALELSEAGYLVSVGGDRLADLSVLLRSLNPDLIILNLELKNASGTDVYRQLENYQAPIVLVTAGEQWSCRSVLELGAQDCLTKPFSMNDLLKKIRYYLSGAKTESIQLGGIPL